MGPFFPHHIGNIIFRQIELGNQLLGSNNFTEENKQTSKTNMSAAKKFTGAPVEETTNLSGLFKSKKEGTMLGSVLAKMSNSKF